jgi:hypothetical protein
MNQDEQNQNFPNPFYPYSVVVYSVTLSASIQTLAPHLSGSWDWTTFAASHPQLGQSMVKPRLCFEPL